MFASLVRKMLYYPERLEQDAPLPPYAQGAEEIRFETEDSITIHGLYWKAKPGRPTILFFHGNAQTVFEWSLVRQDLAPLDCGLFLIDYPGYGKSSGIPTEGALYESGKGALNWLVNHENIPLEQIIVFGKSLGGGVATRTVLGKNVKGLVLESTFCSIPSVAKILLPMLPERAVFKTERYDNQKRIISIQVPIIVIHGRLDNIVPAREGQKLFELANEPKELFMIDNAGHNDASMVAGSSYHEKLNSWLDTL